MTIPQLAVSFCLGLAWLFMSFWAEPLFPLGSPAWLGMTAVVIMLAVLFFYWRKLQRFALKMSVLVGFLVFVGIGAVLGGGIWLLMRAAPFETNEVTSADLAASDKPIARINAKREKSVRFKLDDFDFDNFRIVVDDFFAETKGVDLHLRFGDKAGISTGPRDYLNLALNHAESEKSEFVIAKGLAADPQRPGKLEILLHHPMLPGSERRIEFESNTYSQLQMYLKHEGSGLYRRTDEIVIYVEISTSQGDEFSGDFKLFGEGGK